MKRSSGPSSLLLPSTQSSDPATSSCIGIDEAGRGCLAGPVVAAAVLLPSEQGYTGVLSGLDDSKKLTEHKRLALAPRIVECASAFGLGIAWQEEIDMVNILNATFRAMARAVLALACRLGACLDERFPALIVDGTQHIPEAVWTCVNCPPAPSAWDCCLPQILLPPPEPEIPAHGSFVAFRMPPRQTAMKGADACIPAVSAASVLAKTARDELMVRADALYPDYGFAVHKGYGVPAHLAALQKHGPCALHRMTFRKVKPDAAATPLQANLFSC